jgi:hypothetical protein
MIIIPKNQGTDDGQVTISACVYVQNTGATHRMQESFKPSKGPLEPFAQFWAERSRPWKVWKTKMLELECWSSNWTR